MLYIIEHLYQECGSMSRNRWVVVGGVVGVGLSLLAYGFYAPAALKATVAPVALPSVAVLRVQAQQGAETLIPVVGTVVPRSSVSVAAGLDALSVLSLHADIGERVRAGQLLARLDATTLEGSLQQARADLSAARARLTAADLKQKRIAQLRLGGFIEAAADEAATAEASAAAAAVSSATAALATAQHVRSKAEVIAPVGGTVLQRNVETGDTVRVGAPLFVLAEGGRLELQLDLPQPTLRRLSIGLPARVDLGERSVEARVRKVSPVLDGASRLGKAYLTLPDDVVLPVGTELTASLRVHDAASHLYVPLSALTVHDGRDSVFAVHNGVITPLPVRVVAREGERAEVTDIAAGESIVRDIDRFTIPGARVRGIE